MRSSMPKKLYGDTHSTASAGNSLMVWGEKCRGEGKGGGGQGVRDERREREFDKGEIK